MLCLDDQKQQAISMFDSGSYKDAFLSFVEIYHKSQDPEEKEMIFRILTEGYYQPNEKDLKAAYHANCSLLETYPFQWGFCSVPLEQLPVQVFPVSETEYCLFDKQTQTFTELRCAAREELEDYLFSDLSGPVFRDNDCSLYHLKYLCDNVRRSEDFGDDNHIYLYYSSLTELIPLLLFGALAPLLKDQKPVFLIGSENKKRYPVNFKKEFQIDYARMGPSPVRIEEIQRICFWYKHAHSGSGLTRAILGSLDEIQMSTGHNFNTYSKINGKQILDTHELKDALAQVNQCYTVAEIAEMVHSEQYELHLEGIEDYLDWLRQQRSAPQGYSVKELFCGYFLFRYERRGLNPRVAPMLLYDPHIWDPSIYSNIVFSFPYYTVLTCIREPIMTFIRCQQVGIVGWNGFSTQYMLASEYLHAQFLHPELRPHYYGFRFEDLKTKPEVVCRALCKHLNVPYDEKMLKAESPIGLTENENRGIDYAAPLHWDLSTCLSEFDIARLKMFYEPIHRYYGYPAFSFEEHPLPETLVRELFKYPFRFEYINPHIFGRNAPSWDDLHAWVQNILQGCWRKEFYTPKLIALEETQGEQLSS